MIFRQNLIIVARYQHRIHWCRLDTHISSDFPCTLYLMGEVSPYTILPWLLSVIPSSVPVYYWSPFDVCTTKPCSVVGTHCVVIGTLYVHSVNG